MKILDLFFFGRPMLVIPIWTIYLHFLAVTTKCNLFSHYLPDSRAIVALAALTLIAEGAYVLNQICDVETDRLNNKLFFLSYGLISLPLAGIYYCFLSLAGLAIAFFFLGELIWMTSILIFLGILYSVPGIRLKDRPLAGLLANAIGFGVIVPLMAVPHRQQAVFLNWDYVALTLPYLLAVAVGHVLTTVPDHEGDSVFDKNTITVLMGQKGAVRLAFFLAAAAAIVSLVLFNLEMALVAIVTLIMLAILILSSYKPKLVLAACKLPILLLSLLAGWHYPAYLVLLVLTIALTRVYYKKRFGLLYPKLS